MKQINKKLGIKYIFVITDLLILYISIYITSIVHWGNTYSWSLNSKFLSNTYLYLLVLNVIVFYFQGLYNPNKFINIGYAFIRILYSQFLITVFHVFIAFYTDNIVQVSRFFIFYYLLISFIFVLIYRFSILYILKINSQIKNTIIIGNRHEINKIMENKALFVLSGLKINSFVPTDEFSNNIITEFYELENLGKLENLKSIIEKNSLDKIIIAESELSKDRQIKENLNNLKGIEIDVIPEIYEISFGKINLSSEIIPVLGLQRKKNEFFLFIKLIFDYLASFIGLILSLPILLVCSLIIVIESKGSPIYTQNRVGYKGKLFKIYKLRSMRNDAERDGPQFSAGHNDKRITKFGNFLRKTRLDEIPQLLSVLKGDMSLIGPRPERPEFVKDFNSNIDYYDFRHSVKPGITGWAQIMYSYTSDEQGTKEKLKYDLYYIKNMSFEMDIKIIIKTIMTVLRMKGR